MGEKEMKKVPHKILQAEQNKYRQQTSADLKENDKHKAAFSTSEKKWQMEESKVKSLTAKERTLKGEKQALFKSLAGAVRREYKVGKEMKKKRAALDAEQRATVRKEQELNRLVKQQLIDAHLQ